MSDEEVERECFRILAEQALENEDYQMRQLINQGFWIPPGTIPQTSPEKPKESECKHKDVSKEEIVVWWMANWRGGWQSLYEKMEKKGYRVVKI